MGKYDILTKDELIGLIEEKDKRINELESKSTIDNLELKYSISLKQLQEICKHIPNPSCLIDEVGTSVYTNELMLKAYGATEKDYENLNGTDYENNKKNDVAKYIESVLRGNVVLTPEIEYFSEFNNEIVVSQTSLIPIFNSFNEQKGALLIQKDLSDTYKIKNSFNRQNEIFKVLFEQANNALALLDDTFNIIDVNDYFINLTKLNKEKLIDKNYTECLVLKNILNEDSRNFELLLDERKKINGFIDLEIDDNFKRLEYRIYPINFNDEIFFLSSFTDKTENYILQNEAFEFKNFLEALIENLPIAVYAKNSNNFLISLWNKKAENMFGYSKEYALNKSEFDLFSADEALSTRLKDKEVIALNKTVAIPEETFSTADKQYKKLSTLKIPILNSEGKIGYILNICEDVTDKLYNMERLKDSEEKFRHIYNQSIDAIFIAEVESGILIDCNEAALIMFEAKRDDLIGKSHNVLFPDANPQEKYYKTFKAHTGDSDGQTLYTQIITTTGLIKKVSIKAKTFTFKNSLLVQGIFRDLSDTLEHDFFEV